jgi:uncharacterized NAD-dependent epimerase/dehydratase family protein
MKHTYGLCQVNHLSQDYAGVSLNTSGLSSAAAGRLLAEQSEQWGLPVADPMVAGAAFERLVDVCLEN